MLLIAILSSYQYQSGEGKAAKAKGDSSSSSGFALLTEVFGFILLAIITMFNIASPMISIVVNRSAAKIIGGKKLVAELKGKLGIAFFIIMFTMSPSSALCAAGSAPGGLGRGAVRHLGRPHRGEARGELRLRGRGAMRSGRHGLRRRVRCDGGLH